MKSAVCFLKPMSVSARELDKLSACKLELVALHQLISPTHYKYAPTIITFILWVLHRAGTRNTGHLRVNKSINAGGRKDEGCVGFEQVGVGVGNSVLLFN